MSYYTFIYVSKYPFCWTLSSSWSYVLSSWLVALVSVAVVAVVMVGIRWRELYIDSGRDRETVVFLVSSRVFGVNVLESFTSTTYLECSIPLPKNLKHHVSVSIDPLILLTIRCNWEDIISIVIIVIIILVYSGIFIFIQWLINVPFAFSYNYIVGDSFCFSTCQISYSKCSIICFLLGHGILSFLLIINIIHYYCCLFK